jgi:Protein of unknown function (DUF1566)
MSIADYSVRNPAIDTLFFDPTAEADHWSSTAVVSGGSSVWVVDFGGGFVVSGGKSRSFPVRAVRGGR